jgi:hypothetical protein
MKVSCESREEPEICTGENKRDFNEDSRKSSGKLREQWKKIRRPRHTIYRGGGSFKNLPRFDRYEIHGGCVSTPTFRGWSFLPEFVGFRGNGSLESTRFPEGLVLGNSVKPCHPRNVGLSKFMKQVRKAAIGKRFTFVKKGWSEDS